MKIKKIRRKEAVNVGVDDSNNIDYNIYIDT